MIFYLSLLLTFYLQTGCTLDSRIYQLSTVATKTDDPLDVAPTAPTLLKITGNSRKATDPSLRVFNEIDGGWLFTGECESDSGNVDITGDINAPISAACLSDSFSVMINHNTTAPFFNNASGLSRKLTVSQGSASESTTVFKTLVARGNPIIVSTRSGFQGIATGLTKDYILSADIDMSNGGAIPVNNFYPIAFNGFPNFSGTIDGDGHTVSNINTTSGYWSACLIDFSGTNAVVKNINFVGMTFSTGVYGGAGTKVAGIVCSAFEPGLVIENVNIQASLISGDVDTNIGGIVAIDFGSLTIQNVNVDVSISGAANYVGGVAAALGSNSVVRKAAVNIASVSTTKPSTPAAGLVGFINIATGATIEDSYVTGSISGAEVIGGIVGSLGSNGATIQRVYTALDINLAATKVGGQVIGNPSTYTYTLTSASYLSTSACVNCTTTFGSARTLTQMKTQGTFSGWDFLNVWKIVEGVSYPTLRR